MTTNELRKMARGYHFGGWLPQTLTWAADELERLARENRELAEARVTADTETATIRTDLALNVAMLARQCDLAREAETEAARLRKAEEEQKPCPKKGQYEQG